MRVRIGDEDPRRHDPDRPGPGRPDEFVRRPRRRVRVRTDGSVRRRAVRTSTARSSPAFHSPGSPAVSRNAPMADDQIEFLPPNDAAFGMADIADFVGFDGVDEDMFGDDGPRSRWLPAAGRGRHRGPARRRGHRRGTRGTMASPPRRRPRRPHRRRPRPPPRRHDVPTTHDRSSDVPVGPPGFVFDEPGSFLLAGAWSNGD